MVDGERVGAEELVRNGAVAYLDAHPAATGQWCRRREAHEAATCTFCHSRVGRVNVGGRLESVARLADNAGVARIREGGMGAWCKHGARCRDVAACTFIHARDE